MRCRVPPWRTRGLHELGLGGTMCLMSEATTLAILRRLIDATQSNLSQGAAEAVLQIQLSESDQARMTELAARSNNGTLTSGEAEEYDRYIEVADLLSLWKAHARLSLKRHSSAA